MNFKIFEILNIKFEKKSIFEISKRQFSKIKPQIPRIIWKKNIF